MSGEANTMMAGQELANQLPCAEMPELWFLEEYEEEVKEVCKTCPVLAQCKELALTLEAGLGVSSRHGVWAGLSGKQRFGLYQRRLKKIREQSRKEEDDRHE